MEWIDYNYIKSDEMMKNINYIKDFSFFEYLILIFIALALIFLVFYFLPFLDINRENKQNLKIIKDKKTFIKKIALQREIESEIENEIENENVLQKK